MNTQPLLSVVTISEAARCWGKNPTSVRRAIDSRHKPLVARKSGDTWLIDAASCEKRWGKPKLPVQDMP